MPRTGLLKKSKLPDYYHIQQTDDVEIYYWYCLKRQGAKKDDRGKKRFKKYEDAIKDAVKHYKSIKKQNA